MPKRRNISATFKPRVALEPLAGEAPLVKHSVRHKVHPIPITKGKRQAAEGMVDAFSGKPGRREGSRG